eukprot:15430813-Alexandrium_andersonii.AAC.1
MSRGAEGRHLPWLAEALGKFGRLQGVVVKGRAFRTGLPVEDGALVQLLRGGNLGDGAIANGRELHVLGGPDGLFAPGLHGRCRKHVGLHLRVHAHLLSLEDAQINGDRSHEGPDVSAQPLEGAHDGAEGDARHGGSQGPAVDSPADGQ